MVDAVLPFSDCAVVVCLFTCVSGWFLADFSLPCIPGFRFSCSMFAGLLYYRFAWYFLFWVVVIDQLLLGICYFGTLAGYSVLGCLGCCYWFGLGFVVLVLRVWFWCC